MTDGESGFEFELRALNIARAIHDPYGLQGAEMHAGRERDAVFVNDDDVNVYEFTTERTKAKAEKDAGKIAGLLIDLGQKRENAFKPRTGWFVTREEPTAEQRMAVGIVAKRHSLTIHPISVSVLQQRICNSELYLQSRDNGPFGSIAYAPAASGAGFRVDVKFDVNGQEAGLDDLTERLLEGERALVVGEYGVGKSHGLREVYRALRKEHFRRKKLTPFPLHINLRDCAGLRTPAEILRRHAEEIGFKNEKSLISAWRSGACVLMLDGFDEIVPVRWLGGASDLKTVRWEAMAPVRRLIEESPSGTGVVVCGRAHYFSSPSEMLEALGLSTSASIYRLADFDQNQIRQYLDLAKVSWDVPDWIPGRPLLIGYLAALQEVESTSSQSSLSRSGAWRNLLNAICQRESRMFTAVRPEVIKAIVARVATLARSSGSDIGPISMDMMRTAFIDVNSRQPDEEGLQLLLRLPGLGADGGNLGSDSRVFVDTDLADTAYGEDLAAYLAYPHLDHPLKSVASWVSASSDLGVAVSADALEELSITSKSVLAVANQRLVNGKYDSILADTLGVASDLGVMEETLKTSYVVEGVIFNHLVLGGDDTLLANISYVDCLFQRVDISSLEQGAQVPTFRGGMIGLFDGATSVPTWLEPSFIGVEIERFSSSSHTTSGIMQLGLSQQDKIALTILKKVYLQSGSGRKEGALTRGLDLSIRPLVPSVISKMLSEGWIQKSSAGRNVLYIPVKARRAAALSALDAPADFRLRA